MRAYKKRDTGEARPEQPMEVFCSGAKLGHKEKLEKKSSGMQRGELTRGKKRDLNTPPVRTGYTLDSRKSCSERKVGHVYGKHATGKTGTDRINQRKGVVCPRRRPQPIPSLSLKKTARLTFWDSGKKGGFGRCPSWKMIRGDSLTQYSSWELFPEKMEEGIPEKKNIRRRTSLSRGFDS